MHIARRLVRATLLLALTCGAAVSQGASGQGTPRYAYLFGHYGEFVKIDLETLEVAARWALPLVEGLASISPPYTPPGANQATAYWTLSAVRPDPDGRSLWVVLPTAAPLPSTRHKIAVLELPSFRLLRQLDGPPVPTGEPPNILLSPDGRRLLVEHWIPEGHEGRSEPEIVLTSFDAQTLDETASYRETPGLSSSDLDLYFTRNAYFGPEGRIYDGFHRIEVPPGRRPSRERVNPLAVLTDEQKQLLQDYSGAEIVSGRPWIKFGVADAAAGRVVLTVSAADAEGTAIWVVDLVRQALASPVRSGFPLSLAHLVPSGEAVLLEEIERVQVQDGVEVRKTGRFQLHRTRDLELENEFDAEELAGVAAKLLCMAPGRPLALYTAGAGLYAVRYREGTAPVQVVTTFGVDQYSTCVFANR